MTFGVYLHLLCLLYFLPFRSGNAQANNPGSNDLAKNTAALAAKNVAIKAAELIKAEKNYEQNPTEKTEEEKKKKEIEKVAADVAKKAADSAQDTTQKGGTSSGKPSESQANSPKNGFWDGLNDLKEAASKAVEAAKPPDYTVGNPLAKEAEIYPKTLDYGQARVAHPSDATPAQKNQLHDYEVKAMNVGDAPVDPNLKGAAQAAAELQAEFRQERQALEFNRELWANSSDPRRDSALQQIDYLLGQTPNDQFASALGAVGETQEGAKFLSNAAPKEGASAFEKLQFANEVTSRSQQILTAEPQGRGVVSIKKPTTKPKVMTIEEFRASHAQGN